MSEKVKDPLHEDHAKIRHSQGSANRQPSLCILSHVFALWKQVLMNAIS